MTTIVQEFRPRVEKGAQLLDAYDAEWFRKIDTDVLDLENTQFCVLGQLGGGEYGTFFRMLEAIGMPDTALETTAAHGFDLTRHEYETLDAEPAFSALTELWITAAHQRKLDADGPADGSAPYDD